MSLLTINADLTRMVEVLAEIRDILARAVPPIVIPDQNPKKRGIESLARHSPEKAAEAQMKREIERIRKEEGIDEVEI